MTVVDLYTIQIIGEDEHVNHGPLAPLVAHMMAEMEENLTDVLPGSYRARIRRWDHADEGDESADSDV